MPPTIWFLIVAITFVIAFFAFILFYNRKRNIVLSTIEVPDLGIVKEYANRYECEVSGPWGITRFHDYDKNDLNATRSSLNKLKEKYLVILPDIESAITETKKSTNSKAETWILESISIDPLSESYSLFIDFPNCPMLEFGIIVKIENWTVTDCELFH
jgi:hypothetical protein